MTMRAKGEVETIKERRAVFVFVGKIVKGQHVLRNEECGMRIAE
jgi:hypothetical protein